jgi:hypothetical protein
MKRWEDSTKKTTHGKRKLKKNIHWLNATFILKIVCYHFWHGLMVGENIGHIF